MSTLWHHGGDGGRAPTEKGDKMTENQALLQAFDMLSIFASFIAATHDSYTEGNISAEDLATLVGNSIALLSGSITDFTEQVKTANLLPTE